MPSDEEMFAWLLKTAPDALAMIAWRYPAACAHTDPREAIAAAMQVEASE